MGIHYTRGTASIINVRYSAFLGMLYVSSPETEAAIKEAKALVGEAEVKKGYQGYKGESASAKALAFLDERGVMAAKPFGLLTSAKVIERDVDGQKLPYLNVGLKDDDGRYNLSIDLGQPAAQMLARKLANAEVGAMTMISLFATYGQREGAPRAFAEHGASLRHGTVDELKKGKDGRCTEVAQLSPKEALVPMLDEAMKKLREAGVPESDKETFAKRRSAIEMKYHLELMKKVSEKFTAFDASMERSREAEDDAGVLLKDAA